MSGGLTEPVPDPKVVRHEYRVSIKASTAGQLKEALEGIPDDAPIQRFDYDEQYDNVLVIYLDFKLPALPTP